jgi:hypothetical protein
MVWGGMYVPEKGGMFGQHAWNEVYMGDARWIPVDATAEEIDFVDCGHIRISEAKSLAIMFNALETEVLEYETLDPGTDRPVSNQSELDLMKFTGKFEGDDKTLEILIKNNCLALKIPGRPLFELNDPDENGKSLFKLTNKAAVIFNEDKNKNVNSVTVQSVQRLPRKTGSDTSSDERSVPEKLRDFMGEFAVPMQNETFRVSYRGDELLLILSENKRLPLKGPDEDSMWLGTLTKVTDLGVVFLRDNIGQVNALNLVEISTFPRTK